MRLPLEAQALCADWIVHEADGLIAIAKPVGVSCDAVDPELADDLATRLKRFVAARDGSDAAQLYLGLPHRPHAAVCVVVLPAPRAERRAGSAESKRVM